MIPVFCYECWGSGKKVELDPNTDLPCRVHCKACEGTGVRYQELPNG